MCIDNFIFLLIIPIQIKKKLASVASAIKSVFGKQETRQDAVSMEPFCNGTPATFEN